MRIPQWLGMIILFVFITLGAVLTTFSPLYGNGIINVVIPVLVLIFLKAEFFEKLKLSTLTFGRFLVVVTVLGFLPGNLLVGVIIWLLRINILEATLTDIRNKNYFNVVSGFALIASSFVLTGTWLGSYYLMTNAAMIIWALAYTLWNWDFVIYEFNHQIGIYHIAVLASPLLFVLVAQQPGFWLVARANSLIFAGILQITGKKYLEKYLLNQAFANKIAALKEKWVQIIVMAVNIILCSISVVLQ